MICYILLGGESWRNPENTPQRSPNVDDLAGPFNEPSEGCLVPHMGPASPPGPPHAKLDELLRLEREGWGGGRGGFVRIVGCIGIISAIECGTLRQAPPWCRAHKGSAKKRCSSQFVQRFIRNPRELSPNAGPSFMLHCVFFVLFYATARSPLNPAALAFGRRKLATF